MLALTDHLPEVTLAPGEPLYEEGASEHSTMAVLVSGRLGIDAGGRRLPDIVVPGSFIGEVGALLGVARTVTVAAAEPSVVRIVGDPSALFGADPALALELARQLAARLSRLTAYLSDLRTQYSDAEGHLEMVDAVLGRIAGRSAVEIDGGSDRSPDY